MIIKVSIDLSKIDKSKITTGKNGKKYLNLTVMDNRTPSQFGDDGYIAHEQSKEERENKERQVIIGNWRWLYRPDGNASQSREDARQGVSAPAEDPDLPF
jgi:hypothetical protein